MHIHCIISCCRYRRREPAEGGSSEEGQKRSRKSTSSENSLSSKHGLMGGKNGTSIANSPSDVPMEPIDDGGQCNA